ncbi:MAG: septum formation protein Maf [Oscillospiraceae bacterium]|nr:septum formation protein Maf [Oscillospiraceae bacterium]
MKRTELVLASASPRRRDLLEMLGLFDLTVLPACGEASLDPCLPVDEAVALVALSKARDSASRAPKGSLVLGADTIVCLEGKILGKPKNAAEASAMLHALSGKRHTVYTGMALIQDDRELWDTAAADVWFRPMEDREIDAYIATGSPLDKAGAYGAQDLAALFVERIEGEFYTVVGLPMCGLGKLLAAFGIRLWS